MAFYTIQVATPILGDRTLDIILIFNVAASTRYQTRLSIICN
ncbi:hypothetical protein [Nostoc piscinale]|nr:hypothetical protein [Nostoc piscinale]